MPCWIQCPQTGKLIPKNEYVHPDNRAPFIHGDIASFRSPIDGSLIDDRGKLREHNLRHGVTDSRDYSAEYYKRKKQENNEEIMGTTAKAKRERIAEIQRSIALHRAKL